MSRAFKTSYGAVDNTVAQVAASASATATSASNVAVSGLAATLPAGGTFLIILEPDVTIGIAGTINIVELLVDGVAQTVQLVTFCSGTSRGKYAATYIVTTTTATKALAVQTRNTAGSTSATVSITHSTITIVRLL